MRRERRRSRPGWRRERRRSRPGWSKTVGLWQKSQGGRRDVGRPDNRGGLFRCAICVLLYKVTAFAICEDLQKRNKHTHSITHSLHPRMWLEMNPTNGSMRLFWLPIEKSLFTDRFCCNVHSFLLFNVVVIPIWSRVRILVEDKTVSGEGQVVPGHTIDDTSIGNWRTKITGDLRLGRQALSGFGHTKQTRGIKELPSPIGSFLTDDSRL